MIFYLLTNCLTNNKVRKLKNQKMKKSKTKLQTVLTKKNITIGYYIRVKCFFKKWKI